MQVTFYTRKECPLCEKAKQAIASAGMDVELVEVDIDDEPQLRKRFTDDVPVIFVNGVEAFRHFVDPAAFAAYIRGASPAVLAEEPMPKARLPLAHDEIRALMTQLQPGWTYYNAHELRRSFRFRDFADALAMTNRIGAIAEELQHHPDILLGWGKVELSIRTHDAGAMTRADFILAAKIDRIAPVTV